MVVSDVDEDVHVHVEVVVDVVADVRLDVQVVVDAGADVRVDVDVDVDVDADVIVIVIVDEDVGASFSLATPKKATQNKRAAFPGASGRKNTLLHLVCSACGS